MLNHDHMNHNSCNSQSIGQGSQIISPARGDYQAQLIKWQLLRLTVNGNLTSTRVQMGKWGIRSCFGRCPTHHLKCHSPTTVIIAPANFTWRVTDKPGQALQKVCKKGLEAVKDNDILRLRQYVAKKVYALITESRATNGRYCRFSTEAIIKDPFFVTLENACLCLRRGLSNWLIAVVFI